MFTEAPNRLGWDWFMHRGGGSGAWRLCSARTRRRLAAVTAGVLILTGCTGPSAEDSARATSAQAERSSGSLRDGFEIEPGSSLVGAVFPATYSFGENGWQAVLRVDGDVPRLFEAYVRKGGGLGFPVEESAPTSGACGGPTAPYTFSDPDGPFPLGCSFSVMTPELRYLGVDGLVARNGQGFIRLSLGSQTAPEGFSIVPEGPMALDAGTELAPGLTPENERPVHVVEGSVPIIDPLPFGLSGRGYVALLQVTGELAPVMRGYEAQFRDVGFTGRNDGLVEKDGELVIGTFMAGGGGLDAVGVAGDPSYVLINRVAD